MSHLSLAETASDGPTGGSVISNSPSTTLMMPSGLQQCSQKNFVVPRSINPPHPFAATCSTYRTRPQNYLDTVTSPTSSSHNVPGYHNAGFGCKAKRVCNDALTKPTKRTDTDRSPPPLRTSRMQPYIADKPLATLRKLSYGLDTAFVEPRRVLLALERGLVDGTSRELALAAANLSSYHPDYAVLAGRLVVDDLHRSTQKSFLGFIDWMNRTEPTLFAPAFLEAVFTHGEALDHALRHARDYELSYSSFKALERSYLLRSNDVVVERVQWLWMRVAVAVHGMDLPSVLETYNLLSKGYYTHATPTLVNAGKRNPGLSSCFIVPTNCSTMRSLYDGVRDIASIFMADGGVGVDLHNMPAKRSDRVPPQPGTIPYLRILDATVKLTSAGKGSRPSALTACLPVWHADIFDFVDIRNTRGQDELRARNIFTAIMVPDLFMRRVKENSLWSLFDPADVPTLLEKYGRDFEETYARLEDAGRPLSVVPARALWDHIIDSQIETGTPFVMYHDAINGKSNHQHLGTIHSTNLCTEVLQHVSDDSTAVCTLSSIILPSFVNAAGAFDFEELHCVTKTVVRNTDRVIDITDYPTPAARRSAETTRAIGVGVQGLADVFMMMRIPFESEEAATLNRDIFETIYHASLEASCELARAYGPHPTWAGSPASELRLQYDMWDAQPSGRHDFDTLKLQVVAHGLRNSLLTAQMPTVSTSQIAGVNDGTEPYVSNMYVRRTLAGEFQCVNKWLIRDLISERLWTEPIRQQILRGHGSLKDVSGIPSALKAVYKTAWEISQKRILDMAAARGPFIDQSQSTTIYMAVPTPKKLTSMHYHGWESGLKTGMYYLRAQPSAHPDQFALMPSYPPPPIVLSERDDSEVMSPARLNDLIDVDALSDTLTYLNREISAGIAHVDDRAECISCAA